MRRLSPDAVLWITLLLGFLSMAVALLNVRGVYQAAEIVARGEGESLLNELLQRQRNHRGGPLPPEQLDSFREARPGVSYISLSRPDGLILAASGFPTLNAAASPGQLLQRAGNRYRITESPETGPRGRRPRPPRGARPAQRPNGAEPREGRRARPPEGDWGAGPGRQGPQPVVTIEFESSTLADLHTRARITLAVSLLILGCFLVGAFLLRYLLRERQRMQERSFKEQRLRSLGEMSAVLAHEIRNPLASLKGNAQLLAEASSEGSKQQRKATTVVNEAARLETLCSGLLDFVREAKLNIQPTPIAALLEAAIAESSSHPTTIDVSQAPENWPLDPVRIRQVLSNLVRNATQADPDGQARVVAKGDNSRLVISVLDRGKGIAEEHLHSLFDPFFTTKTEGTGLGLAVADQIVRQHGGTMSASNRAGGGARFDVTLARKP